MTGRKIRVLIVDDSAIVRKVLSEIVSAEPDLEVAGTAPDPYVARDKILSLAPDVITLDIEMPRMDGLTFLEKMMRYHPLPVVIVSSLAQRSTAAALEAMNRGAVDVLAKPGGPYSVGDLRDDLPRRLRAAAGSRPRPKAPGPNGSSPAALPAIQPTLPQNAARAFTPGRIIAIGASTGGTQAIEQVLSALPSDMPPIVITQHIPPGFSTSFASRLNKLCAFEVQEAAGGEVLRPGLVLLAPGNQHLLVGRSGPGQWKARLDHGPRVCYQRPSVELLFRSVADAAGAKAVGVILTGMGNDGAEGMLELRESGAMTIAQDEASCVVYGMPREAVRLGAARKILPLGEIAHALVIETRSV